MLFQGVYCNIVAYNTVISARCPILERVAGHSMTLAYILCATIGGTLLSVCAAALLGRVMTPRLGSHMIGFAVGAMLTAAFMDILPEAATLLPAHTLGLSILAGLFGFFMLEKLALWRHDHLDDGNAHAPSAIMILLGDGVHNFVDGVLIAAAFLQSPALGMTVAISVIAHEIPQELGDFVILRQSGIGFLPALALNLLSGMTAVLGGLLGWYALPLANGLVPYALAIAAASFIYIAAADLVPQMQKRRRPMDIAMQSSLVAGGGLAISLGHLV